MYNTSIKGTSALAYMAERKAEHDKRSSDYNDIKWSRLHDRIQRILNAYDTETENK